jgi:hypothetical protein
MISPGYFSLQMGQSTNDGVFDNLPLSFSSAPRLPRKVGEALDREDEGAAGLFGLCCGGCWGV